MEISKFTTNLLSLGMYLVSKSYFTSCISITIHYLYMIMFDWLLCVLCMYVLYVFVYVMFMCLYVLCIIICVLVHMCVCVYSNSRILNCTAK